ncbi:MAG: hydrogenase [Spirochaetaceae bacterium]|jgi:nitrogenase molybdenum-iron protein beta chain|nr:hydrogenase [Spirochaetaceae bacterium]
MAKLLLEPRYKCALAAMQTVHAIPRAIPVLHSGPGCAAKLNDNNGTSGMYSPNIFPCTSVSEKEVVFGGTDKLRSTIENSLKIIDADLFVVLTGCTQELIGDDVGEVVREFADAKKPVIFANTPGFKGNNYLGHDWVLRAIFEQYLPRVSKNAPRQKGLVNLFVSPPMQDAFWLGNLRELESLISELGLSVNTIFGFDRGLENIAKLPQAELNILVSPWAGLESISYLSGTYNTPLLHYPVLPIGAFETSKFLRAVAQAANSDMVLAERVINKKEAEYYYYIERYSDIFLEQRIMSKRFIVVADAHYTLALTKFLVNDLGMFPETQFVTDDTPEKYRSALKDEFKKLNYGIEAEIEFLVDGGEIAQKIRAVNFSGNPLIIGSSWERQIAQEVSGIFVNVSYPMVDRMVINGHLAGYSGGLKLLEDMYSEARSRLAL